MEFDPQLHIIRNYIRALSDVRTRHECETARYKLYSALDVCDLKQARRWAEALRVSLLATQSGQPTRIEQELYQAAETALLTIKKGIVNE